jgi:hypothetical protein
MFDGPDPETDLLLEVASTIADVAQCNARHRGELFCWYSADEFQGRLLNETRRPELSRLEPLHEYPQR